FAKDFFNALCPSSHRFEVLISAGRTRARNRRLVTAMMTLQEIPVALAAMHDCMGGASRTLADPAAGIASEYRRIAPAIQKYQYRVLACQALANGRQQMRRIPVLQLQSSCIYKTYTRQTYISGAFGQLQQKIVACACPEPAFQ